MEANPFRKRICFFDGEGNEYEFVEYLTEDRHRHHSMDEDT